MKFRLTVIVIDLAIIAFFLAAPILKNMGWAFYALDYFIAAILALDLAARAYALTGDPRHLYAQALAERRLGRCREALILYARVLASVEDDPTYAALVDGTRQGIKLCEASLEESESAKEAVVKPEPEPEPTQEPGTPAQAGSSNEASDGRVADGPRPWFRDPLGGVLLGVGLAVGGGAGGTLWALSNRELSAAERAMDETVYADTRAQARGLRTGAVASLTVGGSLVIGAVVRYVLVRRAGRRSGTTAGRRGTVVRVRGRLGPRSGSLLVGW